MPARGRTYARCMTSVAPAQGRAELEPGLFRPAAIDPESAAWNAQMAAVLAIQPAVWEQPAAVTRARRESGGGPFGPIVLSDMATTRTIRGPRGPLGLRGFVPPTVRGVYLHFHGGGWTLGGAHHNDPLLEATASNAQVAVVSVE